MKWFDNWFKKKCKQAWDNSSRADDAETVVCSSSRHKLNTDYDDERVVHLRIYSASGGCIVEASKYDKSRDQTRTRMYVFPDSEGTDLGNELSKIVTMESLR